MTSESNAAEASAMTHEARESRAAERGVARCGTLPPCSCGGSGPGSGIGTSASRALGDGRPGRCLHQPKQPAAEPGRSHATPSPALFQICDVIGRCPRPGHR
ncbi:hypothetical protein GCM10009837_45660 [Streptomyces durmitorensis]